MLSTKLRDAKGEIANAARLIHTSCATLPSGARLGPYKIIDLVGRGGMGEVYRALDARLGREVAIKVLPPETADHAESLARFRREDGKCTADCGDRAGDHAAHDD